MFWRCLRTKSTTRFADVSVVVTGRVGTLCTLCAGLGRDPQLTTRMDPFAALMPSVPTFHVVIMRPTAVSALMTTAA